MTGLPGKDGELLINLLTREHSRAGECGRHQVQAGPPNWDSQSLGGDPSARPSRQMYQCRFGFCRDERLSSNQGCRSEV